MGLNESYHQARSQILLLNPLPSVNQAYAMAVGDEGQKSVGSSNGNLGMNIMSSNILDSVAMYSKAGSSYNGAGSSSNTTQKYKKNPNLVCDYCKCKGHSKETCYKLLGYPPDFKSKKKGSSGSAGGAYNATSGHTHSSYKEESHQPQANFIYGMNTNIPVAGWNKQCVRSGNDQMSQRVMTGKEVERNAKELLQGCTFTKEQYDQILQMIGHRSANTNADEVNAANYAATWRRNRLRSPRATWRRKRLRSWRASLRRKMLRSLRCMKLRPERS